MSKKWRYFSPIIYFWCLTASSGLGSTPYVPHYSEEGPEAFLHVKSKEQFQELFMPLQEYFHKTGARNKKDHITRIIFIRHGQSVANERGINAGKSEYPISSNGIREAEETGRLLLDYVDGFSGIYCSPLTRTADTVKEIARVWYLEKKEALPEAIPVPELIEKDCGTLENNTREKYQPFKIKEKADLALIPNFKDKFSYKMVDDGQFESLADVFQRAAPALQRLGEKHLGKDVLVCSHVGVMRALVLGLLASLSTPVDLGARSFEMPNASMIVIEYDSLTNELTLKAANKLKFLD